MFFQIDILLIHFVDEIIIIDLDIQSITRIQLFNNTFQLFFHYPCELFLLMMPIIIIHIIPLDLELEILTYQTYNSSHQPSLSQFHLIILFNYLQYNLEPKTLHFIDQLDQITSITIYTSIRSTININIVVLLLII